MNRFLLALVLSVSLTSCATDSTFTQADRQVLATIAIQYAVAKTEIKNKAQAEIILARRLGMLHTMQNLFKYWHIAHLPFAITMFVIMIVHVVVTLTFGYKWIF